MFALGQSLELQRSNRLSYGAAADFKLFGQHPCRGKLGTMNQDPLLNLSMEQLHDTLMKSLSLEVLQFSLPNLARILVDPDEKWSDQLFTWLGLYT